ncbi:hypothetical protein HJC23_011456 [Cyclotella cryptica]|uniref:Protochlorophyllide reductase n=1 Tax=Cyclotella cryptica TaxID=29204 RepID=A0ABD3NUJ6_9STRA|eukprot:CCRYP_019888-RA/>CCRYP_019888-RA protein AED:0.36 eAED:0.36 QI:0/-1/0/1/-1/1/1/0/431
MRQAVDSKADSSDGGGIPGFLLNLAASVATFIYTTGFLFFRIPEVILLVAFYPLQSFSAFIGYVIMKQSSLLGRASRRIFHFISLFGIVYLVDHHIPKPLPAPDASFAGKTVVITGANSGVGFETARQLAVDYGMNVVLGCRSKAKCDAAAKIINDEVASSKSPAISMKMRATPLIVDLAEFASVNSFVSQLQGMGIDILFNNAGFVPEPNMPVNQYGLDPSFTSMHLSHFLLTEELLKQNPSMRVVNTSSGTHHLCAIPFVAPDFIRRTLPLEQNPGCIDEDFLQTKIKTETDSAAYIQAKLANVMHVVEIPRHHPQSTSVAIDLGWVGTHIQPFMDGTLSPTNLGWMRSASVGVLPVLHAILSSDEELMEGLDRQWTDGGILMNVFGRSEEPFSQPWWSERVNLGKSRMLDLSLELWNASKTLIQKYSN